MYVSAKNVAILHTPSQIPQTRNSALQEFQETQSCNSARTEAHIQSADPHILRISLHNIFAWWVWLHWVQNKITWWFFVCTVQTQPSYKVAQPSHWAVAVTDAKTIGPPCGNKNSKTSVPTCCMHLHATICIQGWLCWKQCPHFSVLKLGWQWCISKLRKHFKNGLCSWNFLVVAFRNNNTYSEN